ncbi:MAG: MazG nucleotide pyrophosphohydrolase domain-containing protein [Candidatus Hodarchaeota archaeon]
MQLQKLTNQVDRFIQKQGGYWDIPWLLAAILEELGELSRVLQIFSGIRETNVSNHEESVKELIEEESGDLFFSLICLTNFIGIDLEVALLRTLNKYNFR